MAPPSKGSSADLELGRAVVDVTQRERLEQRLRRAERMEALAMLSADIAHEFNNVLGGIVAYGEMLFEGAPENSPLKRYARNVLMAADRGRGLVEQILSYRRRERSPIDIVPVVTGTLELIRSSMPPEIHLQASAPGSPLVVVADAAELHQVLINLCSNAIRAMGGGGSLQVSLAPAEVAATATLSHGTIGPGRYVRLTVKDSGSGMDATTLGRVMEPFFTAKEGGPGPGLGLPVVGVIVADSSGAIDVTSELGRGTTFTIFLPLA